MAASSKSSQKAKNVVICLLTLWSLISLIIIVVWATSPDWKGAAQCNTELQGVREKLESSREVCAKNKKALEEQVEKEREESDRRMAKILLLQGHLNATNTSLEECRHETVVLNKNISVLQQNVEQLRQTVANLTAQHSQQEDLIDALQNNLTQTYYQTESCIRLQDAAQNQMMAAHSRTRACEADQQYLNKQLLKCKSINTVAPPSPSPPQENTYAPSKDRSAASPLAGLPAVLMFICSALHMMT